MTITATDLFCGAGGSSTGLVAAGITVQMAANHWKLAIDTHSTNHPTTEHDIADLMVEHPSRYKRTDMLWISPECTNHSLAKGKRTKARHQLELFGSTAKDPDEERSRATMREVVEFTAHHRYEVVIVENVVDVRNWEHYEDWLQAMLDLGYDYRTLYLNAMFFGVPQSRDRWYTVFWKRGMKAPDLDFRPMAQCSDHGMVSAVQSFKRTTWGRYGKQYVYRCPMCAREVRPAHTPAAAVIDWSLPSTKIGDRKTPLKPKTIQRIRTGLKKYGRRVTFMDTARPGMDDTSRVHSLDEPLVTQTTQQSLALLTPFLTSQHNNKDGSSTRTSSVDDVLPCLTTFNNEHQLVVPPFISILKSSWSPDGSYVLPGISLDDALSTIVASASQHALITPPLLVEYYNQSNARSIDEPLSTIPTVEHHGLLLPPFITSLNHSDERSTLVSEPFPTIMTQVRPSLVMPPQELTDADIDQIVNDCGFRMLEPHELKLGMSFPNTYVILGNKRDQVRQVGNAVCPNVAQWIAQQCVAALEAS